MRLLFLFIWVLSVLVLPGLLEAKRWNTNKESIIVDAQYSGEDEQEQVLADEPVEKVECYTADGEPGECVTVIRCHPILFSEKGQVRNSGLALTYAQTDDVCSTKNTLDGHTENRGQASLNNTQIGDKVICCARDRIQYHQRSDVDDALETYTTTAVPQENPAVIVTAFQNYIEEEIPQTTQFPFNNAEDVLVVDTTNVKTQSGPAVVEFEIVEDATTSRPSQVPASENEEPVAEPESEPEPQQEKDFEIKADPDAVGVTNSPQVEVVPVTTVSTTVPVGQVIDPEVPVPEVEQVLEQQPPTQACPSTDSYRTWPVFDDYPWLATIQSRAKTGPKCSGSLITETHILTAAHCLHRFNSKDVARMQIRIGFSKRSENDTFNDFYLERKASKIIFHKRFHEQSKMDNNIALIKLDQPVEFDSHHIAPIGVFNGLKGFDLGNCSAAEAGWIKFGNRKVTGISGGVIHFIEPPMSDFHLRESISRVFNNKECGEQLNSQINEKMLCAKSKLFEEPNVSTDFFRWNDGGPLVVKVGNIIQQIGIKSWAYEGMQFPTVYTRTDKFNDWIRDNLKM